MLHTRDKRNCENLSVFVAKLQKLGTFFIKIPTNGYLFWEKNTPEHGFGFQAASSTSPTNPNLRPPHWHSSSSSKISFSLTEMKECISVLTLYSHYSLNGRFLSDVSVSAVEGNAFLVSVTKDFTELDIPLQKI